MGQVPATPKSTKYKRLPVVMEESTLFHDLPVCRISLFLTRKIVIRIE